jgi:glycosyltransferase involved in cell wall biosynthesis
MLSPKLSIIIPVYNEENHIEKIITEVQNAPIKIASEIIIVDDGSTDKTIDILKKYSTNKNFKIIFLPKNKGKGAAIRKGLKLATGDIILIQDADDEYSVKDYPAILEPIIRGNAQVVYGSRFLGQISEMRWQNFLANKILTLTANILYGLKITDEATAYKAFKKEVIESLKLKCERFEFCPEVTAKIAKKGFKIKEVPITYHARNAKAGKKIKLKDAFSAFWTLIKYRFKD